jgi:CDP-2,3-bis-(O-geranylgeranyl)-sn-glycerol synthase
VFITAIRNTAVRILIRVIQKGDRILARTHVSLSNENAESFRASVPGGQVLILKLLMLLVLANGTPVILKKIMDHRFAWPLDGGLRFFDAQPLLGPSKTVRGVLGAILVAALAGSVIGLGWEIGALVGSTAMLGDLFSSFCKRRLKLPASSRATVLDQVPESLFPMLACQPALDLTAFEISVIVVIFFSSEVIFSPLFYRLDIRDHPY